MKAFGCLTSLAVLVFALTSLTFAASKNQGNFTLSDTVTVGSTNLQPGQYKAEWTQDSAGALKVDILQHGKTVATADGKLKDLPTPSPYDAVITKPTTDNPNAKTIDEIDFSNRKQALVLGGE